jgi:hypothetical protein
MTPDPDQLPPPSVDLPDTGLGEFINQMRAQDPAFAEASVLYPTTWANGKPPSTSSPAATPYGECLVPPP